MTNKRLPFFIAGIFLIIVLIVYVFMSLYKDWLIDLLKKGTIGDIIGGISAPIIGIIGVTLVYVSYKSQNKANQLLSNHNEFKLTMELINELKRDILYLYDRKNWNRHTITSPYLANLINGEIKTIPALFKRKLMYIFNDYLYLNKRVSNFNNFPKKDSIKYISDLKIALKNIYDSYLDNYCEEYQKINLDKKPIANLSKKLQELAMQIAKVNKEKLINRIEDDLD